MISFKNTVTYQEHGMEIYFLITSLTRLWKKGPFPVRVERPLYLLPSDSMFRTDIIYKKWG